VGGSLHGLLGWAPWEMDEQEAVQSKEPKMEDVVGERLPGVRSSLDKRRKAASWDTCWKWERPGNENVLGYLLKMSTAGNKRTEYDWRRRITDIIIFILYLITTYSSSPRLAFLKQQS
jgi:hypothetical protein